MTELAIQAVQLSKHFDSFCALSNVNMSVPEGAVYGLVGPNGAGKTTLLQHIAGIYRKDSNNMLSKMLVFGEPVFENSQVKERIAFVPSSFYLPARVTLKSMTSLYSAVTPRFNLARFEELKAKFDLPDTLPLRKFSKGMQKQAMLLLALASCPDVLLLDEPMDGLDPIVRKTCWSLVLSDVSERNTTVVVSSHNLRELEGICSHLGIMSKGSVIREYDLFATDNSLVKVQIALPDGTDFASANVEILNDSAEGRLHTLIVQGEVQQVQSELATLNPVLMEIIPLTLEEIFMYELKEEGTYDAEAIL
jgi:ABC-2 type transport system ATP-binding protein